MEEIRLKIVETKMTPPLLVKYSHSQLYHFKWREMDFCWLIEHLLSPNPRIKGCHIKVPDSVFLRNGKFVLRVKTDHNNFLVSFHNPKRLKHTDIRSQFPIIVRERRKRNLHGTDLNDVFDSEAENDDSAKNSHLKAIENNPDKSMITFDKAEEFKEFVLPSGKTIHGNYYRDLAIVRFNFEVHEPLDENGKETDSIGDWKHIKVINEYSFLKMFEMRPHDEKWKKIK